MRTASKPDPLGSDRSITITSGAHRATTWNRGDRLGLSHHLDAIGAVQGDLEPVPEQLVIANYQYTYRHTYW